MTGLAPRPWTRFHDLEWPRLDLVCGEYAAPYVLLCHPQFGWIRRFRSGAFRLTPWSNN